MDSMTSKLFFWLFFLLSAERISSYQDCNSWEKNDVSDSTFLPNGTVLDPDGRTLYPLGSYWAELNASSFSVHHCPCSLQGPCLRKCCPKDQVMDYDSHECKVHDDPWPWFRPIVVSDFKGNLGRAENDHFRLVFGKHCEGRLLTHPRDGYGFFLNFTDGTLNLPDRVGEALGPDEFCLEYVPKSEAYLPFLCLEPLEPDMKLLEAKCPAWERSDITNPVFMPNGSVWDESMKLLYPLDSYWTDVVNESMVMYGCPCGLEKPCLRKCCGKDEAMEFDQLYCIPHAESRVKTNGRSVDYEISGWFRPNVTSDIDGEVSVASGDHFALIYGNYCWGYPLEPKIYPDDAFFLNFSDGTLNVLKGNLRMGPDEFCMEYYPMVDDYLPYKCFHKLGGTEETKKAINYCYKVRYILYPVAFSVSIFFLFVSLFVYLILPDLRNMHGKCLICHMISALVAFVALAAVQGFGTHFGDSLCWASGFIIYFSLLCTFFWLNIMCIDIYAAFSGMKPMAGNAQERDTKKFRLYVMYAWGIPFVILLITIFMEFFPNLPHWALRPGFKKTCWFRESSRLWYYVIPVGLITTSNVVLFVVTSINIYRISRETKMLKKGDSKRHDQKEDQNRFNLYIKLSIVMGATWAMEIIATIIGGSECYWMFSDMMNILQGLFIFIIFVCKDKVKEMLIKKLCPSLARRQRGNIATSSASSDARSSTNTHLTTASTSASDSHGGSVGVQRKGF